MAILNTAQLKSYITVSGEKNEIITKSNIQRTNSLDADFVIHKTASKSYGMPKTVLTVSTQLTNSTDITLENIHLKDTLTGATFVEGSVKIDSVNHEDLDAIAGFTLPVTLGGSGADLIVSYDILIDEYPEVDEVSNASTITLTIDSTDYQLTSNTAKIDIVTSDVLLYKHAGKSAVVAGNTLTYTIEITNDGTYTHTDLTFTDPIPDGTEFVEDSVKIDGVSKAGLNPANSFVLDDLAPNQTITITFDVLVK